MKFFSSVIDILNHKKESVFIFMYKTLTSVYLFTLLFMLELLFKRDLYMNKVEIIKALSGDEKILAYIQTQS